MKSANAQQVCPQCGAVTDNVEGPVHEYMLSSPGCWKTFGGILAKEYSDPEYRKVHRLTVDTYACQHGGEDPRANQSVNVHLVALYLALEEKLPPDKIPRIMELVIQKNKIKFEALKMPSFEHALTVTDIVMAKSAKEHCGLVSNWAVTVWNAWWTEHQRIKELAKSALNNLRE